MLWRLAVNAVIASESGVWVIADLIAIEGVEDGGADAREDDEGEG